MKLTASPFDRTTGELLPVYRDAYLRGDLSREHTEQVDAYLAQHKQLGSEVWLRFHRMQQTGEQVQPVGWVQRQLERVRTATQRTRRQAAGLVAIAALLGGAVFAGNLPVAPDAGGAEAPTEVIGALRMTTVRGKILDENGRPLVGATVLDKNTRRGVSTNANGEYVMLVPAERPITLAYGYGGYVDDEVQVQGTRVENVTLVPKYDALAKPARKAKRWLAFLR